MTTLTPPLSTLIQPTMPITPKSKVNPEKAWEAAQKFETTFTSHIIQQMFAHNDTGLFGGGKTELMFRSLWAEKIADSMPGLFGIAESVYPVLLKNQEVNND